MRHRVAVIGSGNWCVEIEAGVLIMLTSCRGSAIAKIIAENIKRQTTLYHPTLSLWVFEEKVDGGQDLSHVINTNHENTKYLPGVRLPDNIKAEPDLRTAARDATILVFNMPHQFLGAICRELKGHVHGDAKAISCIKGINVTADRIQTLPYLISSTLGIYCGALSGANIANEVAREKFCETTIGYAAEGVSGNVTKELVRNLFHRPYFHVNVVDDVTGVCLAGALKNIIAVAAGLVDGLEWGDNAKAAVMRVGILEMQKFGVMFFPDCRPSTFTEESCGIADVITSSAGGRNRLCAEQFVKTGKSMFELEAELLNGQKLQGAITAREVHEYLVQKNKINEFPLFTAVHEIVFNGLPANRITDKIAHDTERACLA